MLMLPQGQRFYPMYLSKYQLQGFYLDGRLRRVHGRIAPYPAISIRLVLVPVRHEWHDVDGALVGPFKKDLNTVRGPQVDTTP